MSRRRGLAGAAAFLLLTSGVGLGFSGYRQASEPVKPGNPLGEIAAAVDAPAAARAKRLVDYERVDARLTRLMAEKDMVGLGVAIIEDGELSFLKGYGVTQAGTSDPVTVKTVFRWASLSKGVAGTLVGALAAEGKLSLTDPVARYSRTLRLPGGAENRVTVAELLSHRVGLSHNAYDDRLEGGQDPRLIRASLALLKPQCAPGLCHGYQNVAFDAASEIVETVTGQSYADVARQRLFAPLGMSSASLTRAGLESAPSWARPHTGQRMMTVNDSYYRVPAAGGMNSSILDLSLWMRAQMGLATDILPEALLEQVHAPLVSTPRRGGRYERALLDPKYGMGWRDYVYAGHRLVGHRGAVNGYRSLIIFDPVAKSGVAMLWNSSARKPVGLQLEVLDMLYGLPRQDWMEIDAPLTKVQMAAADRDEDETGGAPAEGKAKRR